jgi:hypothetical protein
VEFLTLLMHYICTDPLKAIHVTRQKLQLAASGGIIVEFLGFRGFKLDLAETHHVQLVDGTQTFSSDFRSGYATGIRAGRFFET